MATLLERATNGWNAFRNRDTETTEQARGSSVVYGGTVGYRNRMSSLANERNTVTAIYTQIANDVASVNIRHVKFDEHERVSEVVDSGLNRCLTLEANIDQAATFFRRNIADVLFEEGVAAVVPVDTSANPDHTGSYTIHTMRVGRIVEWFPKHVLVNLYNDSTGNHEDVFLAKTSVAIIQNPFYNVMNEPNGTVKRLVRKLTLIDNFDEEAAAGKLDIIIQLPYALKGDLRKNQAEERRKEIEMQLKGASHGIAYIDGTEKITQLNRAAENNLLESIKELKADLYSELGLTKEVFDGTADEATMLNYFNRTVNPILTAITEELKRTFLTKTAVTQGHSVEYFRDPFKLVPLTQFAEIADKLTRNEIASPNEIRAIVGLKPSKSKGADDLHNSNLKVQDTVQGAGQPRDEGEAKVEKLPPKELNQ